MDINELVHKNLIEKLEKDGFKIIYDTIDSWGKRFDLQSNTSQDAEKFMETHYRENEDMDDRGEDLDYKVVAYYIDGDTGEKKDILTVSKVVEFEGEYDNPAADMYNRV